MWIHCASPQFQSLLQQVQKLRQDNWRLQAHYGSLFQGLQSELQQERCLREKAEAEQRWAVKKLKKFRRTERRLLREPQDEKRLLELAEAQKMRALAVERLEPDNLAPLTPVSTPCDGKVRPPRPSLDSLDSPETRVPDTPSEALDDGSDNEAFGCMAWDPGALALPELYPWLSVHDMMSLRTTSWQGNDLEAMARHATELSDLSRPASAKVFCDGMNVLTQTDPWTDQTDFVDMPLSRKIIYCQQWCLGQNGRFLYPEFPEPYRSNTRRLLLQQLLSQCRGHDLWVSYSAHYMLEHYSVANGCLEDQCLVMDGMCSLLEALVADPADDRGEWDRKIWAMNLLGSTTRALDKPRRQRWVSLLVKILLSEVEEAHRQEIIDELKHLWRADEAPWKTYYDSKLELDRLLRSGSSTPAIKDELWRLLSLC